MDQKHFCLCPGEGSHIGNCPSDPGEIGMVVLDCSGKKFSDFRCEGGPFLFRHFGDGDDGRFGKVRQLSAVPYAESGTRFHVFREMPIEQAVAELGMTIREVEVLLVNKELEGAFYFPRWVGVRHESLAAYMGRRFVAANPDLLRERTTSPMTSPAALMMSRLRAVSQAFTEKLRAK